MRRLFAGLAVVAIPLASEAQMGVNPSTCTYAQYDSALISRAAAQDKKQAAQEDVTRATAKYDAALEASGAKKAQRQKIVDATKDQLKDLAWEIAKTMIGAGEGVTLPLAVIGEIDHIIDQQTAIYGATDAMEQAGIAMSLAEAREQKAASDYASENSTVQQLKAAGCNRVHPPPTPPPEVNVDENPVSVESTAPDSNELSGSDDQPIQVGCQMIGTCR